MKKKFMLGAILLTAAIGASASVGFISWCGVQVCTPSEDYFENPEDAREFYEDLTEDLCGSKGSYTIVP
ncbi:MAG: hypothetical protein K1V80_00100 [Muribaculaceae bacterium]